MKKRLLAILFSSLFLVITVTPSLAIIDSDFGIIVSVDFNEEEQKEGKEGKEGKESNIDMEWKVWSPSENHSLLTHSLSQDRIDYYNRSYNLDVMNVIYNPPEYF